MPKKPELSPPYVYAYNRLVAFFEGDETIQISELDDETRSCTISTDNYLKYLLLKKNLRAEIIEANTNAKLSIDLKFTGDKSHKMTPNELAIIVADNPRFSYLFESKGGPFPYSSVVFKNGVVQFFDDNLFNPYACKSMLMEQMVKEIFNNNCFCATEPEDAEYFDGDEDEEIEVTYDPEDFDICFTPDDE